MKHHLLMDNRNPPLRFANAIKYLLQVAVVSFFILMACLNDVSFGQGFTPFQSEGAAHDSLIVWSVLVLILLGDAAALFGIYYYFNRKETERLKELTQVIHQLSDGNLHASASEKYDRYRELSCAINDMSTNIQEVLIFLWKQNTQAMNLLGDIASKMQTTGREGHENLTGLLRHCNEIQRHNEDICMILRGFRFFGVNVNDDGVWQNEL